MDLKVVAIIQARMGSTRLPGKVMKSLVNKTVLEHVINRVKASKKIDEIIIATTTKDDDNVIVKEALRLGVKYYRGSEEDVLSRYYYAAKESNADVVVRITSDCPLIDPDVVDAMINKLCNNSGHYISNTVTRTYPRGLDCEVFSFNALETASYTAKESYQREHVTPYIYENDGLFQLEQHTDQEDNSDFRCTLDTDKDYTVIKWLLERLSDNYSYQELIELLKGNPDIVRINSDIVQKDLRG